VKFRVIDEKGCYLARDPKPVRLELGADTAAAKAYSVTAPVYELLPEGAEIEGAHIAYGPHLEPLDEEAVEARRQYFRAGHGSTRPTDHLPVTGGFGDAVQGQLNRLLAEAELPRQQLDELTALRAREAEMAAQVASLTEQVAKLIAMATPAPSTGRKGSGHAA
jgi:hypothetical protein